MFGQTPCCVLTVLMISFVLMERRRPWKHLLHCFYPHDNYVSRHNLSHTLSLFPALFSEDTQIGLCLQKSVKD